MQSSYPAFNNASTKPSLLHLSTDFAAVIIFSLLGLVISAALIAYQGAAELGSILGQLN